ncbi:MAG: FAD-dependent oxidoreductase [Candidatus Brennerbacteria bacterium]|nr:FAD-dependent oxidoreductase [Candidatus Brennerbacteria bacterium]
MEFPEYKKNIVVLGGGFGGLQAALRLGKFIRRAGLGGKYSVVLVDKHPRHIFTPLLYEVATTSEASLPAGKRNTIAHELEPLVAYPLKELLESSGVEFHLDEVRRLDILEGVAHLKTGKLDYEYLVIALGSETNYFDIPGLAAHGLPLKTFEDALAIRERLDPRVGENKGLTRVVIGGAGSTGVELAGEIREWSCARPYTKTCNIHVTLVESGHNILGAMDARVQAKATARLKKLRVQIFTEERVVRVDTREIHLKSGEHILHDIFIWTGGVRAVPLTEELPMKREGKGRIEITSGMECLPIGEDLRVAGNIYAVGDIACLYDPETKQPSPWMARPAMMGARCAAKNIIERIKFAEGISRAIKTHTYRVPDYPYIVPVGGKYAVAKIGPFVISGFLAWVFKGIVELNYFLSIMPWWRALSVWLRGFLLFIKNDRMG